MKSGGAEYAYRLSKHLAQSRLDVHVLTSIVKNGVSDPGIRLYPIMRQWTWVELPRLLRVVYSCSPEVVDIHFTGDIYNNHPMITFLPSILKWLRPNVTVVVHIEYPSGAAISRAGLMARVVRKAIIHLVGTNNVDWGFGALLRDSDRLVVLSELHCHILKRHLAAVDQKCVVIPPPPLIEMSQEDNGRARGRVLLGFGTAEFVIGYYGLLYPRKGIETLLDALALIKMRIGNVRLILIGGGNEVALRAINRDGYVEELRQLAENLGILDNVVFTGYYSSDSDVGSQYLRASDICVLPFDDGVMLNRSSFAVAAAHGLPIITTKGDVLESPFVHEKNVFLCPPRNPQSLASAVEFIMKDQELRRRLREGALQLASEWFSWDKVVQRTIEAFQVMETPPSSDARCIGKIRVIASADHMDHAAPNVNAIVPLDSEPLGSSPSTPEQGEHAR